MGRILDYILGTVIGSIVCIGFFSYLPNLSEKILPNNCGSEGILISPGTCLHITLAGVLFFLVIPFSFVTSLIGCFIVDKYNKDGNNFPIIVGGLIGGMVWIILYLLFAVPSLVIIILL